MFKVKNGKVYGSRYAFEFPRGFKRIEGSDCFSDYDLVFGSEDNEYLKIVIYFEKEGQSAKKYIQEMFDKNSCLIKLSDFVSVKRGKRVGIGIFYENTFGATQHYIERYDFKKNEYGETQIYIDISLWSGRGKNRQTIQEALELPAVKAFLESIEYY